MNYFRRAALGRRPATRATRSSVSRSPDRLVSLLVHEDPEVRIAAARALGLSAEASAVPHLLRGLEDGRLPLDTVVTAIERVGSGGAFGIMAGLASPAAITRTATAELAGSLRLHELREGLELLLGDQDHDVRRSAARALGRLAPVESVLVLVDHLNAEIRKPREHGDEQFAITVAETLGKIGSPAATAALETASSRAGRLAAVADAALASIQRVSAPSVIVLP